MTHFWVFGALTDHPKWVYTQNSKHCVAQLAEINRHREDYFREKQKNKYWFEFATQIRKMASAEEVSRRVNLQGF